MAHALASGRGMSTVDTYHALQTRYDPCSMRASSPGAVLEDRLKAHHLHSCETRPHSLLKAQHYLNARHFNHEPTPGDTVS